MKKYGMLLLALIALVVVPTVMAKSVTPGAGNGNDYISHRNLPAYNFAGIPVEDLYAKEIWNRVKYEYPRNQRTALYGETSSAVSRRVLTRNVFTQRAFKDNVRIDCTGYNNGALIFDTAIYDANCPRNVDVPGAYMAYMMRRS